MGGGLRWPLVNDDVPRGHVAAITQSATTSPNVACISPALAHDHRMELEAAEALAGLACFPALSDGSQSVKDESNDCISSFDAYPTNSPQKETPDFKVKGSIKSGILTSKPVRDEHTTKTPSYHTNCSSRRKSRQNLTEAEIEARKIRRVLANRESARQTIRRRQAVFEELTRKAVDLAWENENLKKEKDTASKQYDSLKTKNECLKAKMSKLINNNETEETREESNTTTNEPSISTSSTTSPFIIYNQPSFLPLLSVQLQQCGTPLYLLPYPWLLTTTLPHNNNENHPHMHSFNLNDKPRECQQFFPENTSFPSDGGGGRPSTDPVSCEQLLHDTDAFLKHLKTGDGIHQVPVLCSGKRVGDTGAATEARKRRKQLTRLKNNFHCRQLRMH
ncbi:hypothetical protein R6Q59_007016 [Mikania micrantha]